MVEQAAVNREVEGSSPSPGAKPKSPGYSARSLMYKLCRGGGIGRRTRLKISGWKHRTGSIPVLGTITTLFDNIDAG